MFLWLCLVSDVVGLTVVIASQYTQVWYHCAVCLKLMWCCVSIRPQNNNMNWWGSIRYWQRLHRFYIYKDIYIKIYIDFIHTHTIYHPCYILLKHIIKLTYLLGVHTDHIKQSTKGPSQAIRKTTLSEMLSEGSFQVSSPHLSYFTPPALP